MTRQIQGGAAAPVAIVAAEDSAGNIGSGLPVSELQFAPVGSHGFDPTLTSAVALVNPPGATKLLIQALTQNVRYTLDGTTPTASKGFQLKAGDPPVIIPISSRTTVKIIQESATASVQYQFGS